jgi:hypothetical protein
MLAIALFEALGLVQENRGKDGHPVVDALAGLTLAGSLYIFVDFLSDCKKAYATENKKIFLTERKAVLVKNILCSTLKLSSAVGCFCSGIIVVVINHYEVI